MIEFPAYKWAVTLLQAIPAWPNPTNIEEVQQAICHLLDLNGSEWVLKRPELREAYAPVEIPHGGGIPYDGTKLDVFWQNHHLWFSADKAAALAQSIPDSGYAYH